MSAHGRRGAANTAIDTPARFPGIDMAGSRRPPGRPRTAWCSARRAAR
ncbi:hypothetical protein [Embleya hyalina]|nr:hypothetical protein [Embleya hyalina]